MTEANCDSGLYRAGRYLILLTVEAMAFACAVVCSVASEYSNHHGLVVQGKVPMNARPDGPVVPVHP